MNHRIVLLIASVTLVLPSFFMLGEASAAGPFIVTGAERAAIQSKPITRRPMRRGHFYGNTIRRINALTR